MKKYMCAVFFGPARHGKSSLAGRLLYELGGVSQRELQKLVVETGEEHAWRALFDRTSDERRAGCTIHSIYRQIFTINFEYTIFVAPGKLEYRKKISHKYSMADLPILVLSSQGTEFEDSIDKTQQHIFFMYSQLCNFQTDSTNKISIIVTFTKWDVSNGGDVNLKRFNFLKEETKKIIGNYFHIESFVCVSTLAPQPNIVSPFNNFFHEQPHDTLLSALDNESLATNRCKDQYMNYFPNINYSLSLIYGKEYIKGIGVVVILKQLVGQTVPAQLCYFLLPSESEFDRKNKKGLANIDKSKLIFKESKIFSIEKHHQYLDKTEEGQFHGLNNKGVGRNDIPAIMTGSFCFASGTFSKSREAINNNKWLSEKPYYIVTNTTMLKHKLNTTGKKSSVSHLREGAKFILVSHGSQTVAKVISLKNLNNDNYRVLFHIESFIQLTTIPFFNRFVLIDHDNVFGMGSVDNIYYEEILKIQSFKKAHLSVGSELSVLNDDIIQYISNIFSQLFNPFH